MAVKLLKRLAGNILHHIDQVVFTDTITPTASIDNQDVSARREVGVIGDSEDIDGRARVLRKTPAETDYGLATRPIVERSVYGEALVAELVPIIQASFPVTVNPRIMTTISVGSGASAIVDSMMKVSSGTTTASDALVSSIITAKYHSGIGTLIRYSALFDAAGTTDTEVVTGFGNEEDGFFFGYDGETFGILHRRAGEIEHQTLTVSAGAGDGTGNITITLDGDATTVAVAQTDTIQDVVRKIAAATFASWEVQADGTSAIFISHIAEVKAGSFSFADTDSTGVAASFAETITGVAADDDWIAKASWNVDPMDGTGPSGQTLDVSKGNVYAIRIGWLGFGPALFYVRDKIAGSYQLVHDIQYTNTNTVPSIKNPTLPFYAAVKNIGTTTDVKVLIGSFGMFQEGKHNDEEGVRFSTVGTESGDLTTEKCVLVIKNKPVFQGKSNRVNYLPTMLTFSAAGTAGAKVTTLRLVHAPVVGGLTAYSDISTATSVVEVDTASTTRTGGNVIGTFVFGQTVENFVLNADDLKEIMGEHPPGLVMAITIDLDGGTSDVNVGLVWKEQP